MTSYSSLLYSFFPSGGKKPSQASSSTQMNTTKTEKIPLLHLLKGAVLNAEGIPSQITSPLQGVWLSTNQRIFKGKGYVIHWNIRGKEATLGRCSAPENYCKHIPWQGHSAQWIAVTQNAFCNQHRTIRQKNKVNHLENNGRIILWADTDLKSS